MTDYSKRPLTASIKEDHDELREYHQVSIHVSQLIRCTTIVEHSLCLADVPFAFSVTDSNVNWHIQKYLAAHSDYEERAKWANLFVWELSRHTVRRNNEHCIFIN